MALTPLRDGPLKLNPLQTYLAGPLTGNYISANSVAFPILKGYIVTISGKTRKELYTSLPTKAEVDASAFVNGSSGPRVSFLFERTDSTHLKMRLSSAQVKALALQENIFFEMALVSADDDLDEETVAQQAITFSGDAIEIDATPDPIPFNVNGTTLSLVFSLPGGGSTPHVDTYADLPDLQATLVDGDDPIDVWVDSDEMNGGEDAEAIKYQVTRTTLKFYLTASNA